MKMLFAVVLFVLCCELVICKDPWIYMPAYGWDRQWKQGIWNYLDSEPVERSRIAIVGEVFIPKYGPRNATILDVGCGEGTLLDFLPGRLKSHYRGIDISKEAIAKAKKSRPKGAFEAVIAHQYIPPQKFDVILFSEVLYYVDHEALLKQYESYLTPDGIIISSLFFNPKDDNEVKKKILDFIESYFQVIDDLQVVGFTQRSETGAKRDSVMSHIQVAKRRKIA
jgi:2-polyprenyl-3-methyl-5-hydroxy-6-metoxy-1,4-benzoquinol methylase